MTAEERAVLDGLIATEKIAAMIDAIEAVPVVNICRCGHPHSEHTYWEDRIYDVNGYRCPNQTFNQDFRFDKTFTTARHRDAKVACLSALLAAVRGSK